MEMNKFYRLVLYVLYVDKHLLCGSRKYQFRESVEIPTERGGCKDQNFEGKYEPKLEIPPWREYGSFLEVHICWTGHAKLQFKHVVDEFLARLLKFKSTCTCR